VQECGAVELARESVAESGELMITRVFEEGPEIVLVAPVRMVDSFEKSMFVVIRDGYGRSIPSTEDGPAVISDQRTRQFEMDDFERERHYLDQ
jgi:hypothetical protein